MAISNPTVLNTTGNQTNANTVVGGSVSPTANALVWVCVGVCRGLAGSSNPVTGISAAFSITGAWDWVEVGAAGTGGRVSATVIGWAIAAASPGSGAVTVTFTNNQARRSITTGEVVSGFDTTTPVIQEKVNSGVDTTLTITFDGTPATGSLILAAVNSQEDTAITPDTDYTELQEQASGGTEQSFLEVQYKNGSADTTVAWSDLNTVANTGAAIEIAEAAAPGTGNPWYVYAQQ